MTARKIFVARPRLDCSFKVGPVPVQEGPPRTEILRKFGDFIDGIVAYHRRRGDTVTCETRALWQFDLREMQDMSENCDLLYFPHRLREQFPIGGNALYYKNAPLFDHFTIDPAGWGASLSFLPPRLRADGRAIDVEALRAPILANRSIFEQPPTGPAPVDGPYILFLCQLPHDETIRFHSHVTVEEALDAVIRYSEFRNIPLVVKGHPANPRSMEPLKRRAQQSGTAHWVDNRSIHSCLRHADRVFLVNSGSGMEAILHDRTVIRFGRSEYDSVTPMADPQDIPALESYRHDSASYNTFLSAFAQNCVHLDDDKSYEFAIEGAISRLG